MGTIEKHGFGVLPEGLEVDRYRLTAGGIAAEVLTFGATLCRLDVPDRDGRIANVVLGLPDLEAYRTRNAFFGSIAGRYANRIARGRFELDGTTYQLARNDGENTLHGGRIGFDKRVWAAEVREGPQGPALALHLVSADGDEGFPGRLEVEVVYALNDRHELRLDYRATTDRPTVLNLTNHSYFNLAGETAPDCLGHEVELRAEHFLPTNAGSIPDGPPAPVDGTPFDFRAARTVGARIRDPHPQLGYALGYDHCWVLDAPGLDRPFARVREPGSGRVLEVATTEPGVQMYSGNKLNGSIVGVGGLLYRQSAGFCLETQHFPDSPNRPDFPTTVLRPGDTFESTTVFRLTHDGI